MSEMAEELNEAIERAKESRQNAVIAFLVAVTATFMALSNVKGGNIVQAMALDQSRAVDSWAYYQAKSTKMNLAEVMLDQLNLQYALTPASADAARTLLEKRMASYRGDVERY